MGLLSLGIDPMNIISLFTLLSPFFISTFFILQGALQGSLSGIVWLFGVIIAQWGIGFALVRTAFSKFEVGKANKQFRNNLSTGMSYRKAYEEVQVKKRAWLPSKDGKNTGKNFKDMCALFIGPYDNSIYTQFSMPSLNSIFHAFTLVYVACCAFDGDGRQSLSGTIFVLTLLMIYILNMFSNIQKKCSTIQDIGVGTIIGGAFGVCWYFIAKGLSDKIYPENQNSLLFFQREFVPKGAAKCRVEEQQFRCEVDESGHNDKEDDEKNT